MDSNGSQPSWRDYVLTTNDFGAYLLPGIVSVTAVLHEDPDVDSVDSEPKAADSESYLDEKSGDNSNGSAPK